MLMSMMNGQSIQSQHVKGADDRHLEEMEKMLIEGTWPDGDERRADQGRGSGGNVAPAAMDAQQSAGLRATEDDVGKHETYQHHCQGH